MDEERSKEIGRKMRQGSMKKPKNSGYERSYLLIELLICLSLFTACSYFLIFLPFSNLRKEVEYLYKMELERDLVQAYVHAKELFYCNSIPFNHLTKSAVLSSDKVEIHLHPKWKKKIYRKELVFQKSKSKKVQDIEYFLVKVQIKYLEGKKKALSKNFEFFLKKV
ncbi:MAG: hypothetical protein L0207_01245 [Chlamydiae bacterium]|nr:hypothetical protein [Chlamydiota bacterium]